MAWSLSEVACPRGPSPLVLVSRPASLACKAAQSCTTLQDYRSSATGVLADGHAHVPAVDAPSLRWAQHLIGETNSDRSPNLPFSSSAGDRSMSQLWRPSLLLATPTSLSGTWCDPVRSCSNSSWAT